jgi:hypothetical protein
VLRRWGIKWAIMRSLIVPATDSETLLGGQDLREWHVFIGRSQFKEWRHTFASHGAGFRQDHGSMSVGFMRASVALGTAIVSVVRFVGLNPETDFLPDFKKYNGMLGKPLAEVGFGATALPDIFSRPKLALGQTEPLFLFLTADPVSPAAAEIRAAYEDIRMFRAAFSPGHDL